MKIARDRSLENEIRDVAWVRELARPYLKGFSPAVESTGTLRGYRFSRTAGKGKRARIGFFAGFLLDSDGFEFFEPAPPECVLFAFVHSPGSALHKRLVARPQSLFRSTHEYISWLTHHPPRFQFSAKAPAALMRHLPVSCWPEGRRAHYASNFLTEGLAWLVRSGLVRHLAEESRESQPASRAASTGSLSEDKRKLMRN